MYCKLFPLRRSISLQGQPANSSRSYYPTRAVSWQLLSLCVSRMKGRSSLSGSETNNSRTEAIGEGTREVVPHCRFTRLFLNNNQIWENDRRRRSSIQTMFWGCQGIKLFQQGSNWFSFHFYFSRINLGRCQWGKYIFPCRDNGILSI